MANQDTPEIRHMTSSPSLLSTPHKTLGLRPLSPSSQPRLGSRSPNSIPSSPTSVHSSSSAIFERDIEPLPASLLPQPGHHLASPGPAHANPHRTPRARASEPLDAAVPSVLTSAAAVLAGLPSPQPLDGPSADPFSVSIIAPAHILPASALPSPAQSPSPTSPPLPLPFVAPTSASPAPSRSATLPPPSPPPSIGAALAAEPSVHDQSTSDGGGAGGETLRARNRLSFVSYADLLLSAPVGTVPLGALTAPASAAPPPHLAAVEQATSVHPAAGSPSRPRSVRASVLLEKDLGGEWEREGLGRGLEERLEALLVKAPGVVETN